MVGGDRRAIGVVRVSQAKGREGDSFISPGDQRQRIGDLCERERLDLVDCFDEIDISGGAPLARRAGLRTAIEMVEKGEADVVVVAYFDRLVRSLTVQAEILERVENAGGQVVAADVGEVRQDTAARWLNATMLGMVAEYHRRTTAERTRAAQVRAVEQGRPPIILPDGLRRDGDEIVVDEPKATAVREAVGMRADGETFDKIRQFLEANGIKRSYAGVRGLLRSRLLIGEIVFDDLRGTCPAVVDKETWERAQATVVPTGRRPTSQQLLARLRVLRCGSCGGPMVVGKTGGHLRLAAYRCPSRSGDCPQRTTIMGDLADQVAVDAVKAALRAHAAEGTATLDEDLQGARQAQDDAQDALDRAIAAMTAADLLDEPAAVEKLTRLRHERDHAQDALDRIEQRQETHNLTVTADDVDKLTMAELRDLIVTLVERVDVAPSGRGSGKMLTGAERLTVAYR